MLTNKEKRDLLLAGAAKFVWCSENPDKGKEDWPRYDKNGGDLPSNNADCYVCKIIGIAKNGLIGCNSGQDCIIDWGGEKPGCLKSGSIYDRFCESSGKVRSLYASIIAETLRLAAAALPEDTNPLLKDWHDVGDTIRFHCAEEQSGIIARCPSPKHGAESDYKHWPKVRRFIVRAKKFVEKWAEPIECDALNQRIHVTTKHLPGGFFFDPEARDILAGLED